MPDSDDTSFVLREQRGAVLVLTLNRPNRLNAWNDDLETQYFDALDEADADPGVRAVVVTGAGRGFCAGADMDDLGRVTTGDLDTDEMVARVRPKHHPAFFRKPLVQGRGRGRRPAALPVTSGPDRAPRTCLSVRRTA